MLGIAAETLTDELFRRLITNGLNVSISGTGFLPGFLRCGAIENRKEAGWV
ncbi:hypothetical protein RQN30_08570 [Arcanobacterium hippocoleae]